MEIKPKKPSMLVLFFSLLAMFALPQLASASGYHVDGNVYITNSTTSNSYISGAFSNRWNTTVTTNSTYLGAYGYANSSITFYGRDADGDYFSCYVPTTSALYATATEIRSNLTDGAYIYIIKPAGTSECSSVYLLKASYWLH